MGVGLLCPRFSGCLGTKRAEKNVASCLGHWPLFVYGFQEASRMKRLKEFLILVLLLCYSASFASPGAVLDALYSGDEEAILEAFHSTQEMSISEATDLLECLCSFVEAE